VCSKDVEAVGKTRCKKFHGSPCEAERVYLNKIVLDCRGIGSNCFKEIGQRQDAIICYQCSQKLKKCKKMETDLQALKQEFICYLNNLSVEGDHMIPSVTSKRKLSKSAHGRTSKVLCSEKISQCEQLLDSGDCSSESDNLGEGTSEVASPDVLVSSLFVTESEKTKCKSMLYNMYLLF